MNLTLRVQTDRRSVILKQARPWVEKYDHIAAPWDRLRYERRFYSRVATINGVARHMPALLAADDDARTLLLEDLGAANDLTNLYAGGALEPEEIRSLALYLAELHQATAGDKLSEFTNREMRQLNHAHIFEIPLSMDLPLDLDALEPGLAGAAKELRSDREIAEHARELGAIYLADGTVLVHGDFFPGSWLRTAEGIKVIDAEFCHAGHPEIDLGCALAHFSLAQQPLRASRRFLASYLEGCVGYEIDLSLLAGMTAMEIIRRLIGVAQLPIPKSTGIRAESLERARRVLLERSLAPLGVD